MRDGFRLRKVKNERHDLVGREGLERMRWVESGWRLERRDGADSRDSTPASMMSRVIFLATSSKETADDDLTAASLLSRDFCVAPIVGNDQSFLLQLPSFRFYYTENRHEGVGVGQK
uniref:Uncharacterized protein n=1 Tax=Kalanchoe fedtschenkoi TaxID=63787 RepID=A0A7N0UTW7_KALFE